MPFRTLLLIALLAALSLPAFGQGLTWETTTTIPMAGDQTLMTTSSYLPRMFKQMSDKEATIFRLDKQIFYTVNYEKKEYSEMTFAELEALVQKTNKELEGQMAKLKEHLAGLPEDQRKSMEQMMAGQLGGPDKASAISVAKSSETKTISGYACTNYVLTDGGKDIGSIWTSTAVPGYAAMQKDFKEFSQRLASQMTARGPQMADAMQKVEGFPIETTIGGMTAMVTKISKASVAQSEFEVPAGFKKVPFMSRKARGHQNPTDPAGDGDEQE